MRLQLWLAALCCCLVSSPAALGYDITFVSFHDTDAGSADATAAGLTAAADIGYTDLLTANGHNVTRFLTHEPLDAADLAALNGSQLVILSRSVSSSHYDPPGDWNTLVTAPVINMGGYLSRSSRLNLTDGTTMTDTVADLTLLADNPAHAVFAGVSLDGGNNMVNPFAGIVTEPLLATPLQRGVSINMANLVGGTLIASSTEAATATGAVIAEWNTGAVLNNGDVLAGPRMIFMSGSREASGITSQTAGLYDLYGDGETMFLNAVNYMAVPEPSSILLGAIGGALMLTTIRRRRR